MGNGFIANADAFSVSTQIYVRMRRVTGRVIDAMYVVQNKDYAKNYLAKGQIKEIILKSVSQSSDIVDKLGAKFNINGIKEIELKLTAKKQNRFPLNDKLANFVDNPNAKFFELDELKNLGFDGNHKELVKIKLGKSTRMIDISHVAQLRPYFDIDDKVSKQNGHPVFASIDEVAKDLLSDIQTEML